jgi:hypothetical protein
VVRSPTLTLTLTLALTLALTLTLALNRARTLTLTLVLAPRVFLDQATDRGRSSLPSGAKTAGNRAYVDALFGFSFPLGLDYMGACAGSSPSA